MYRVLLAADADEERTLHTVDIVESLPGADESVEVTVLNVFEEFDIADGDGGMVQSEEFYDETALPESVEAARDRLERRGIPVTVRREHGDPAELIVEIAGEIDADTIVMSGHNQSPVGKVLFGSVTQAVLLNADRPVMVAMAE